MAAPAIDVVVGEVGGVGVVAVRGRVDDTGTVVRAAMELLELRVDGGHVVLDLSGLDVEDPAALCAFLARLAAASGGVPIPTVAPDAGLRRLLRACGSGSAGLALFASVAEAAAVARPAFA